MARKLEVEIIGDASSLRRAFKQGESSGGGFGRALGKLGKVAAGVGVAIGAGLAVAARVGFKEFIQGQKVAAQTAAVLKSTGGAANVTAKEVDKLATSLMKKSGVDDEAIASGQNMLLTFTRIRNEVGKGNDIFKQATEATLDLSVAMGKDMSSSAILVGKALNDPIKGMTALSKAGIQFTDDQKAAIKTMVESGDVMGAQKMILKELETQFGGSAEAAGKTFGGQLNILKETFSNLAGEIVGKFVPHLVSLANFVAPLVIRAMDAIGKALTAIGGFINTQVIPRLQAMWAYVKSNILPQIGTWTSKLRDELTPAYDKLKNTAVPAIQNIGAATEANRGRLINTWNNVKGIFSELIGLLSIAKINFLAMLNPINAVAALLSSRLGPGVITAVIRALEGGTGAIRTFLSWINAAISAVERLIGALSRIRVPKISLPSVGSLRGLVPRLAAGGIVTRPTLAVVGEAGPEAVIPLGGGRASTVSGSVVHEHHYHGPVVQDKVFLDYLKNLAAQDTRRNGRPAFG